MKQQDAKDRIIELAYTEPLEVRAGKDFALEFYLKLQNKHPNLLNFRCAGDKYQTIACWLKDLIEESKKRRGNV